MTPQAAMHDVANCPGVHTVSAGLRSLRVPSCDGASYRADLRVGQLCGAVPNPDSQPSARGGFLHVVLRTANSEVSRITARRVITAMQDMSPARESDPTRKHVRQPRRYAVASASKGDLPVSVVVHAPGPRPTVQWSPPFDQRPQPHVDRCRGLAISTRSAHATPAAEATFILEFRYRWEDPEVASALDTRSADHDRILPHQESL
jgi:hypothetical protein